MKKLLLFSAAIAMSAVSFAQSSFKNDNITFTPSAQSKTSIITSNIDMDAVVAKSTGADTFYDLLSNAMQLQVFDTAAYYVLGSLPADSGAFFGPNSNGFDGFAEWFSRGSNFGSDTTMKVIAAITRWGGNVQPNSTKSIAMTMWGINTTTYTQVDSDNFISETPGTVMYTQNVNLTSLYMDTALTVTLFTTPQTVNNAFWMGYTPNFPFAPAGGDTVGLYSSRNGYSWFHGAIDTQINNGGGDIDTVYLAQTCFRQGGNWQDVWVSNVASVNLSILPVYTFSGSNVWNSSVASVNGQVELFNNFPNPATNETNINMSLATATNVQITIMDMAGRKISTQDHGKLSSGKHTLPVSTANLANGNYIYMISTSNGGAVAAQFTVAK